VHFNEYLIEFFSICFCCLLSGGIQQEVTTLREQQMKDRNQIVKLKDKVDAIEGKKRFDPARAFQPHTKENDLPQQHQRLRDGKFFTNYIALAALSYVCKFCLINFWFYTVLSLFVLMYIVIF